jgi:hypothetical protein
MPMRRNSSERQARASMEVVVLMQIAYQRGSYAEPWSEG